MRVGLFLTNEHPFGSDFAARLDEQLGVAEMAVASGWDSIFTGQHYVSDGTQRLQPLPFLARLSALSGSLRLGTGVQLWPLGNPVAMAEEFASLDVLTGGRVVAGIGLGYRDEEIGAMGVARHERVHRLERNLEIARALWSGAAVTADEPWCRLDGVTIGTPPVQRPIPVWIGGTSDTSVRRAGRLADGWLISPAARADTLAAQANVYRAAAEEHRRVAHIAAIREVYVAPTTEQALALAMPHLQRKYASYRAWGQTGRRADGSPAEVGTGHFVVGDPDHVTESLAQLRDDVGIDEFVLRTDWPGMSVHDIRASLALLSTEVLPRLRIR